MREEPQQHSKAIARYAWLPDNVLPKLWCPCGARMQPTGSEEYPHEFKCVNDHCDAHADMHPPDQGWEPMRCGAMNKGLRCNSPIRNGEIICKNCTRTAIHDAYESGGPLRRDILELVGRDAIQRESERQNREHQAELEAKRAAAELARKQTTGHVVYYARLGNNHIKIGTTVDLPRRMVELRVVNVTNLLAAEPGGYDVEHQRHQQFKKWRYNRRKEDFGEGPDLLDHIKQLRTQHGDPYQLAAALATQVSTSGPAA